MKTLLPALKKRFEEALVNVPDAPFNQVDIAPDTWWRQRITGLAFPFLALTSLGVIYQDSQISNHTDEILRVKITTLHRASDPESAMFDAQDGLFDDARRFVRVLFEDPEIRDVVTGVRLPFTTEDFEIAERNDKGNIASLYAVGRRHRVEFVRQFDGQEWYGMRNPVVRTL